MKLSFGRLSSLLVVVVLALTPTDLLRAQAGSRSAKSLAQKVIPSYQCNCVIHIMNLTGQNSAGGVGMLQNFLPASSQPSANACQNWCSSKAAQYVHPQNLSQATASQACLAAAQNGATIRAYYKTTGMLQTGPFANTYQPAVALGVLVNIPAVTKQGWRCPPAWNSNTSNQPGDFTNDQRCKRLAGSITINPVPADGTQLGNWGFSWGNELWAYGSVTNGGAPAFGTFVVTPRQCHF